MTNDLEDRLRRTLHRQAERAPLATPTWTGPTYVPMPHHHRRWPVLAAVAAVVALLVVGVVVVQRSDRDDIRLATVPIDARPRALPEGLSGWDVVDAYDSAGWNPVGDPSVQLFRRDDGATVRVMVTQPSNEPGPGEAPQSPVTTAVGAATNPGPVGAEPLKDVRGGAGAWQTVGVGGVVWFTDGGQLVSVQVEGVSRGAALSLVEDLAGTPGAYMAPSGFAPAGTTPAEPPGLTHDAHVTLARSGAATNEVAIWTRAVPPGRPDIRLDQSLGMFGTYEGTGPGTILVVDREDSSPWRAVAWLQNGAQIVVSSGTASLDELRAIAAVTHLVSAATWEAQARKILDGRLALPEISRVPLGDATVVARGSDPTWPAVLCLEADGLARCFRNQATQQQGRTVVGGSVVLDDWWIIGFAQNRLSVQSGLTPESGTTTLRRARLGDVEWFAARIPDSATWVQGELSTSDNGIGGPWYRP